MIVACLFLFVAASLIVLPLLRSSVAVESAIRDARQSDRMLLLAADAVLPAAERLIPASVFRSFEESIATDERASRIGARRLVGIVTLAGLSLTVLATWSALAIGSVKLAICSLALLPISLAFAQMHFRGVQRSHQKAIRREFPYALDLLVLLCRSGAPPAIALARVAADRRTSAWGRELQRAVRETELGTPRAKALADLAERVRMPEVSSFVATVRQAEELGRPLGDALEQCADRLREQRVQAAEASAGAAGVKIMIPAIIVFMASVVMLLGPFAIKFMRDGLPF